MARPAPLPEALGVAFRTAHARRAGATQTRMRAKDLSTPFRGVRTTDPPQGIEALAAAYATRMSALHVFVGITAARLWGLPLRALWTAGELLVVGVPSRATRTRSRQVRVRSFDARRLPATTLDGLRVIGPAATVLTLARDLEHDELVELLDALVTPSRRYPGLRLPRRPYASVEELAAFAASCRGLHGVGAFLRALADVRVGVDSPRETRCRRVLVAAGLPEPLVQHVIRVGGERIATVDLAYPQWRIAIEYEGEHHLTDPAQWASDIARFERLQSLGWTVIRVTKADLRGDGSALVARVRAAIERAA